jgi:hypothetical protein
LQYTLKDFSGFFCWFYTYVLFIDMVAMMVGRQGHRTYFQREPPKDDSGQVWFKLAQWFQRRRFLKKFTDGRRKRMPIDGNSSYRWAKNCSVGRSWQAEHVCNLNLISISYSFWNKGWKVLKFRQLDEKKGNNSKMGNGIYFKIAG